jgi:hypothetical protein
VLADNRWLRHRPILSFKRSTTHIDIAWRPTSLFSGFELFLSAGFRLHE